MTMDFLFRIFDRFWRDYEDYTVRRTLANLAACGRNVRMSPTVRILSVGCLTVGNDVDINEYTHVFAGGGVFIGDGCLISSHCVISSATHPKDPARRAEVIGAPVRLERGVWLGAGVLVLPGVTIGEEAIIGAGAVVTKDVPARAVCVGNPARVIQTL